MDVRTAPRRTPKGRLLLMVGLALLGGFTAGCYSIDAEIKELNDRSRLIQKDVDVLTNERKKLVTLITQLEIYKNDRSAAREAKLDQARKEYEAVRDAH